jgi:hypothetical protein
MNEAKTQTKEMKDQESSDSVQVSVSASFLKLIT